jgi:hypothetical protein
LNANGEKSFNDGKIKWARHKQIANYLDYQKQKTIPVFIAIGIGGEPYNPEKLFVYSAR